MVEKLQVVCLVYHAFNISEWNEITYCDIYSRIYIFKRPNQSFRFTIQRTCHKYIHVVRIIWPIVNCGLSILQPWANYRLKNSIKQNVPNGQTIYESMYEYIFKKSILTNGMNSLMLSKNWCRLSCVSFGFKYNKQQVKFVQWIILSHGQKGVRSFATQKNNLTNYGRLLRFTVGNAIWWPLTRQW